VTVFRDQLPWRKFCLQALQLFACITCGIVTASNYTGLIGFNRNWKGTPILLLLLLLLLSSSSSSFICSKNYTKYTNATRQVKPSRTARLTGALTAALKTIKNSIKLKYTVDKCK